MCKIGKWSDLLTRKQPNFKVLRCKYYDWLNISQFKGQYRNNLSVLQNFQNQQSVCCKLSCSYSTDPWFFTSFTIVESQTLYKSIKDGRYHSHVTPTTMLPYYYEVLSCSFWLLPYWFFKNGHKKKCGDLTGNLRADATVAQMIKWQFSYSGYWWSPALQHVFGHDIELPHCLVGIYLSIYLSIYFLYQLNPVQVCGGAGAYPSCYWARGRVHPGAVASQLQH